MVEALDRWSVHSVAADPLVQVLISDKARGIPLESEEDGVPVDIGVILLPEGAPELPNLRWMIGLERGSAPGISENFRITEIPDRDDRWDIERNEIMTAVEEEDEAAYLKALDEEDYATSSRIVSEHKASVQQARELGMADVSEDRAKRLTTLLETAQKREFEEGIEDL